MTWNNPARSCDADQERPGAFDASLVGIEPRQAGSDRCTRKRELTNTSFGRPMVHAERGFSISRLDRVAEEKQIGSKGP